MKKILLPIIAAALVFAGCASAPAGGGDTPVPAADQWWFITREEGGVRARNNQVNLFPGENFVYVYFTGGMPGANFESITLDFTVAREVEISWQALYDTGVWGAEGMTLGNIDKGPITSDLSGFTLQWWGTNSAFIKEEMRGLCLRVVVPEGRALFTMTSVEFNGLEK
jgi:hypothetical protein